MPGVQGYKTKASRFSDPGATAYVKAIEKFTKDSYAELSTPGTLDFKALGGLPGMYPLLFVGPKDTRVGYKRDVGKGGPNKPTVDFHTGLADATGVTGINEVTIYPLRADAAAERMITKLTGRKPTPLELEQAAERGRMLRDKLPDGKATTTFSDVGKDIGDAAGKALNAFGLGDLKEIFDVLYGILSAFTEKGFWIRAGKILLGVIILFMGITKLGKAGVSGKVGRDVKAVGKAAGAAPAKAAAAKKVLSKVPNPAAKVASAAI